MKCIRCQTVLSGQQTKFCSTNCTHLHRSEKAKADYYQNPPQCMHCEKIIGYEKSAKQFCSYACRNKFAETKNIEAYNKSPVKCGFCCNVIQYKQLIRIRSVRKRIKTTSAVFFCSTTCSAKYHYNWKRTETINCLNCSVELKWRSQKFCSKICRGKFERSKSIREWLEGKREGHVMGGGLKKFVRTYLLELRGEKCEECGHDQPGKNTGRVPLEIDHIDGDYTNSVPKNLRILCRNCHADTPTFGQANYGNGRRLRFST